MYYVFMIVCGLDEVGRGALAGPLVAAAVILNTKITGLKDSKKLSAVQRNKLHKEILKRAEVVKIEMISVNLINKKGIGWANKEIFRRLIKQIHADQYIVDGNLKIIGGTSIVKADNKFPEVMAASIVAKVTRDKLMKDLHTKHPKYGWQTNVGYGTRYHLHAICEHGTIDLHRTMFVRTILSKIER